MKKIPLYFLTLFLLVLIYLPILASSSVYTWFCVHRADHCQPKIDETIEFISKYDAFYIDHKHGDHQSEKIVYLTFDAGYNNGNIDKILDILKDENVPAAFFVLGHLIEKNTDIVNRMFTEGHLVCNHTFSHKRMTGICEDEFNDELKKLEDKCFEITGNKLSMFYRPPEGVFDESTLYYAQKMGYKTVFWSFAYEDWDNENQPSSERAKKKILDNIHNGEIMLLHPTSSTNATILRDVIKELKLQGYKFGSLNDIEA